MTETAKIAEQIDEIGSSIKELQDVNDRAVKSDALDKEHIKKCQEASTDALAKIDEIKASQKALTDQNERLEKLFCASNKGSFSGNQEESEIIKKSKVEFSDLLRKTASNAQRMYSPEVTKYIAETLAKKYISDSPEVINAVMKTMAADINSTGGYWVLPDNTDKVITRVFETSNVRKYASIINTASSVVTFPIDDQSAEAIWAEGERQLQSPTGTPRIGKAIIHVNTLTAQPKTTREFLEDSIINAEEWLQGKVGDIFARYENTAFVKGTGNSEPRGILSYGAWSGTTYEQEKLEHVITAASDEITDDELKKLQSTVLSPYDINSVFAMNRKVFWYITTIKDGQDRYVLDTNSFKTGDTAILLGKPVAIWSDMNNMAAGAKVVTYGDFRTGYTVVDRLGIRVNPDTLTEVPFIKYNTHKRVGGGVTNYQSIKILQMKA